MSVNGLLIDYEYCTGCHSCEVAGIMEHKLGLGKWCIKFGEEDPWIADEENERWEMKYVPVPTQLCDLCADRVEKGRLPTCVHHCQAHCMEYGSVEELAKKAAAKNPKSRIAIFVPSV